MTTNLYRMRSTVVAVSGLVVGGCGESIAPDDLGGNFSSLWEDFDRTYPFFGVKGIDWVAVRDSVGPLAVAASTDAELFDILGDMLLSLRDGHVRLDGRFGRVQYTGWYDRFPANYDPAAAQSHLVNGLANTPGRSLRYARVADDIGYVYISSFGGSTHGDDLDAALTALGDGIAALVIDIRDNGGGNDMNGRAVAARFVDRRRLFRRVQFRDGPAHDAFTQPEEDFIEPGGAVRFTGPVALLTNRRVFSSSEAFVLAMRILPTVTVVGDTTGGGSANAAERELPVGFRYTVSRWLVTTPDGATFEGVGLVPDIPVWISDEDAANGRDTILARAIEHLRTRLD